MEPNIAERLEQLKIELEKGQQQMGDLERRRQELRDTMLRISGAIQVLEEMDVRRTETTAPVSEPAAAE